MSKNDREYKCPACGHGATAVVQTSPLASCIIRTRRCQFCEYVHETGEFPMDMSTALLEAVQVLAENAVAKMGAATQ